MNWSLGLVNPSGQRVSAAFPQAAGLLAEGFRMPEPRTGGSTGPATLNLAQCGLGDCAAAIPAAAWLAGLEGGALVIAPEKALFMFRHLEPALQVASFAAISNDRPHFDAEAALEQAMYASWRSWALRAKDNPGGPVAPVSYNPVEVLCALVGCAPALPSLPPSGETEGRVMAEAARRSGGRPLVIFQPRSASPCKDWGWELWQELDRRLTLGGCRVLWTIAPTGNPEPPPSQLECGVEELAAWLAVADLVVCPDSLCFHLAAAVGAPCVGLFGPTDGEAMGRWYPLARVVQAHDLARLAVSRVAIECLDELDAVLRVCGCGREGVTL